MPRDARSSSSTGDDLTASDLAVITGVFDPITLGHTDVIRRGSRVFRRLIIGVDINPEKESLFTLEERMQLVQASVSKIPGIQVKSFDGLAVRFVRQQGANVILRGVRSVSDVDHELTMSRSNRVLEPGVETVFLPAGEEYAHISSSLIRQIARHVGRRELSKFVPAPVIGPLLEKFRQTRP